VKTEVLPSAAAVAKRAAALVLAAAERAIGQRGAFSLVLAGGTTPMACYEHLAGASADWGQWHVYFGDERCLAPGDPERNSAMAATSLLDRVAIPTSQVHPIPAERGADTGAAHYLPVVATALPFDLVLLGMGEDGHTASLFPGHRHPDEALVVPVCGAPKPPPERVSLGAAALANCRQLLVLVTGSGKRPAMQAWKSGEDLPIARVAQGDHCRLLLSEDANP
jgi:6-phosphogluconolactonase